MDSTDRKLGMLLDNSLWDHLDVFSDEALSSNPNSALALASKGLVRLRKDEIEAAQQLFLDALQVDPSEPMSKVGLSLCHYRNGNIERAEQGFLELLKVYPNNQRLHSQLCRIYAKAGKQEKAEQATANALSLFPENEGLLVTQLLLAHRTKSRAEVRELSESLLQRYPENLLAHICMGSCCYDENDLDGAEYHFQTGVRLAPGEKTARLLSLVEAKRTGQGAFRLWWWFIKSKLRKLFFPSQVQKERRNINWDR